MLSLCTVNTVTDSWLHLKLWSHYILTGSLFTLRLQSPAHLFVISSLLALSISLSLGIIFSLDAYIKRLSGKHTVSLVLWICRIVPNNLSLQYNIIFLIPLIKLLHRGKIIVCFLCWPGSPTVLFIFIWHSCASEASLQPPLNDWSTGLTFVNTTDIFIECEFRSSGGLHNYWRVSELC